MRKGGKRFSGTKGPRVYIDGGILRLLLLQQLSSENILKAVGQEHPLDEHYNATTDDIDANKLSSAC